MKAKPVVAGIVGILLLAVLMSFVPSASTENLVDDVLTYTNKFRKSNGLPALEMRDDLNDLAEKHSRDMASGKVEFGHSGFKDRQDKARKKIKDASIFAENVAYGSNTGKDVVETWKNSSGHRRNMLGPYKYIGIGVARNKKGVIYYTQFFVD